MKPLKLPLGRLIFEAYRPAIEEGLMRFYDGKTPPRGCQGWLCLTEQGVTVMLDHIPEFGPWLQSMLKGAYGESYDAHFMLAGGLAAN